MRPPYQAPHAKEPGSAKSPCVAVSCSTGKKPRISAGLWFCAKRVCLGRLVLEPAHAAAVSAAHWRFLLLLWDIGNQGFGGEHQCRDGAGILKRSAGDLGGINDAGFHQVSELIGLSVV